MKAWVSGVLLCCSFAAGCGGPDFEQNREKWRNERPEEYVIAKCGTGFDGGCSVDAVSGSMVVAHASSFAPDPSSDDWEFSEDYPKPGDPVEDLFDAAERQGDSCSLTRLSFDPAYGFVSNYYEDCGEEGGGQKVLCFEPDTVDVTVCMR